MTGITRRIAVLAFAAAAISLADGADAPLLTRSGYSNEVESLLVRTIVSMREQGLKQAMNDVDALLARNPNYKLGYMIKGDLLMASAGQPVAFASTSALTASKSGLGSSSPGRPFSGLRPRRMRACNSFGNPPGGRPYTPV